MLSTRLQTSTKAREQGPSLAARTLWRAMVHDLKGLEPVNQIDRAILQTRDRIEETESYINAIQEERRHHGISLDTREELKALFSLLDNEKSKLRKLESTKYGEQEAS